ncbi:MAG: archaemetzincin family Zn-dependent metalloprotease, partial [Candidatus Asgardarchaeia archaeon]
MLKEVAIMSVGSFDEGMMNEVARRLSSIFNLSFKVERGIRLPENAYDTLRRQYISDIILQELGKVFFSKKYFKIIGLTEVNIYTDNLNFIFGQAIMNGCCAIVSTYMLDERNYGRGEDDELLLLRTVKECVHELGHTLGLSHC